MLYIAIATTVTTTSLLERTRLGVQGSTAVVATASGRGANVTVYEGENGVSLNDNM